MNELISKLKHRPPSSYYEGGFETLSYCTDCFVVSDFMAFSSGVCRECGGRVRSRSLAGKWEREYKTEEVQNSFPSSLFNGATSTKTVENGGKWVGIKEK